MTARTGVQFPCARPPEDLRPFARAAEAAGFDELWVVEDCFFAAGPSSAVAALAATDSLTVGMGILPAVARNPAFAAMELATIERLYPGRVLPGFGHGVADWMRQVGAFPESQLAALEEVAVAVRRLLAGERVTVHGRHVHLDAVRLDHPPAVAPPVSLGVRGPRSLAVAGRVADGTILAEGSSPAYVRWAVEQIAAPGPHRVTVFAWWGPTLDDVRPTVARALAKARNDVQRLPLGIQADVDAWRAGGADPAAVPDEWVHLLALVGDPAPGRDALADAGAHTVVLTPVALDPW
jgi:alkanesulfonate monooxygenase SsuD/methylene tetrahydromethanopterin reductase-like flavin-dependent oxidoreductase (luciferase family)